MKKILIGLLVLTLLSGALLSGCGPRAENRVPEPVNDLIIAIGAEPENLDPLKMMSSPAATISEHMIERLIYSTFPPKIKPKP